MMGNWCIMGLERQRWSLHLRPCRHHQHQCLAPRARVSASPAWPAACRPRTLSIRGLSLRQSRFGAALIASIAGRTSAGTFRGCAHLQHAQMASCGLILLSPSHLQTCLHLCEGGRRAAEQIWRSQVMHAVAVDIFLRDMGRLSDGLTSDSISAIFCIVVMVEEPPRQHSRTYCFSPLLHDLEHQGLG